jgi:hypothetical protein
LRTEFAGRQIVLGALGAVLVAAGAVALWFWRRQRRLADVTYVHLSTTDATGSHNSAANDDGL